MENKDNYQQERESLESELFKLQKDRKQLDAKEDLYFEVKQQLVPLIEEVKEEAESSHGVCDIQDIEEELHLALKKEEQSLINDKELRDREIKQRWLDLEELEAEYRHAESEGEEWA